MDALIVDDSPVIRRVLQLVLQPLGNCDIVQSGQKALDSLRHRLTEKRSYDLICLDLGLPDLEGLDVLRQVRSLEAEFGIQVRSRIMIVTSSDDLDMVRAASQNGADAYLVKPLDKQRFLKALEGLGLTTDASKTAAQR